MENDLLDFRYNRKADVNCIGGKGLGSEIVREMNYINYVEVGRYQRK